MAFYWQKSIELFGDKVATPGPLECHVLFEWTLNNVNLSETNKTDWKEEDLKLLVNGNWKV